MGWEGTRWRCLPQRAHHCGESALKRVALLHRPLQSIFHAFKSVLGTASHRPYSLCAVL